MVQSPTSESPDPIPVVATDTVQGVDMKYLHDLATAIRVGSEYPDVHSLLVMRNGKKIFEEYFGSGAYDAKHTLQSVTKSITSALVGIALHEGHISDIDERVLDFFPQWKTELELDSKRAKMRIDDILTMRTGTDYHESGSDSPHFQLNDLSRGWDRFWLDRPMLNEPGTVWQYDSGGVIALSSMLKERTGSHADEYAARVLFEPLGITDIRWFRNSEGHPHTGGGLHLRSRALLSFGQLYLQRGRWSGEQVVPEAWIDSSFVERHTFSPPRGSAGKTTGYGYLWWILAPDPNGSSQHPIYAAMGYRGQYVFVVPEHEMVVVVTGWMPPAESGKPVSFLYSDILPAIVRR